MEKNLTHKLNKLTADKPSKAEPVHLMEDGTTGDRFLIYSTQNGPKIQLQYQNDKLWMTQAQIADLFDRDVSSISRHISNIFEEDELDEMTSLQKVQRSHGRPAILYSLDLVISVGYRVNSKQGTQFRRWATDKLVQFATKGFIVDVERLKNPEAHDHFKELREIIREIRASEANVYKEVKAICALCSDYETVDEKSKIRFFATIQNKLHYAITQMTGPEVRLNRADFKKDNMGLTSWKGARITQSDTLTAKNYLGEEEIRDLNRFTNMLLDYFEQETDLRRLVKIDDASNALEKFIKNNERPVLKDAGTVSRVKADEHVKNQYQLYKERVKQLQSDETIVD